MERAFDITDMAGLKKAAEEVLGVCSAVEGRAAVLALHGDLGAGKTTFVQTLAASLKVKESVTSPTFVIMKKYETADPQWNTLVHIDAYRLESTDELSVLGFSDELMKEGSLVAIEWAERVTELLPPHTYHLRFDLRDDVRTLTLNHE